MSASIPVLARAYIASTRRQARLLHFLEASFAGFWLGILNRRTLEAIDEAYYDLVKMYRKDDYNRGGLWKWEEVAIGRHFQAAKTLLLAAAGGGREVLALRQMGYEVDGFDCQPRLVEYANEFLEQEGFPQSIQCVQRDQCPRGDRVYDGVIVGWGAYNLIQGRRNRVSFLKQLRNRTSKGSPILVSFFDRSENERSYKVTAALANAIRWLLRRAPIEIGDSLAPKYYHFFEREELASEMREGGFEMHFYSTNGYGHAVGTAV